MAGREGGGETQVLAWESREFVLPFKSHVLEKDQLSSPEENPPQRAEVSI